MVVCGFFVVNMWFLCGYYVVAWWLPGGCLVGASRAVPRLKFLQNLGAFRELLLFLGPATIASSNLFKVWELFWRFYSLFSFFFKHENSVLFLGGFWNPLVAFKSFLGVF